MGQYCFIGQMKRQNYQKYGHQITQQQKQFLNQNLQNGEQNQNEQTSQEYIIKQQINMIQNNKEQTQQTLQKENIQINIQQENSNIIVNKQQELIQEDEQKNSFKTISKESTFSSQEEDQNISEQGSIEAILDYIESQTIEKEQTKKSQEKLLKIRQSIQFQRKELLQLDLDYSNKRKKQIKKTSKMPSKEQISEGEENEAKQKLSKKQKKKIARNEQQEILEYLSYSRKKLLQNKKEPPDPFYLKYSEKPTEDEQENFNIQIINIITDEDGLEEWFIRISPQKEVYKGTISARKEKKDKGAILKIIFPSEKIDFKILQMQVKIINQVQQIKSKGIQKFYSIRVVSQFLFGFNQSNKAIVRISEINQCSLRNILIRRSEKNEFYTEEELLCILYKIAKILNKCQSKGIYNLSINDQTFFLNHKKIPIYKMKGWGDNIYIQSEDKVFFNPLYYSYCYLFLQYIQSLKENDLRYLSPELYKLYRKNQFKDQIINLNEQKVEIDPFKSDIYSLGILIFDMMILQRNIQLVNTHEFEKIEPYLFQNNNKYPIICDLLRKILRTKSKNRIDSLSIINNIKLNKKKYPQEKYFIYEQDMKISQENLQYIQLSGSPLHERKHNKKEQQKHIEKLLLKADTLLMINQTSEALMFIEDAIYFNSSLHTLSYEKVYEMTFAKGICLFRLQKFKEAEFEFEQCDKMILQLDNPTIPTSSVRRPSIIGRRHSLSHIEFLQNILQRKNIQQQKNLHHLKQKSQLSTHSNKQESQKQLSDQALKKGILLFYQANCDFYQQKYDNALQKLDDLWNYLNLDIKLESESIMQFYLLEGKILSDMNNHVNSLQSFKNLCIIHNAQLDFDFDNIQIENEFVDISLITWYDQALLYLGKELELLGNFSDALDIYQQCLDFQYKFNTNLKMLTLGCICNCSIYLRDITTFTYATNKAIDFINQLLLAQEDSIKNQKKTKNLPQLTNKDFDILFQFLFFYGEILQTDIKFLEKTKPTLFSLYEIKNQWVNENVKNPSFRLFALGKAMYFINEASQATMLIQEAFDLYPQLDDQLLMQNSNQEQISSFFNYSQALQQKNLFQQCIQSNFNLYLQICMLDWLSFLHGVPQQEYKNLQEQYLKRMMDMGSKLIGEANTYGKIQQTEYNNFLSKEFHAYYFNRVGKQLYIMNDPIRSKQNFQKAFELFSEQNNFIQSAFVQEQLGMIELMEENEQEAEKKFEYSQIILQENAISNYKSVVINQVILLELIALDMFQLGKYNQSLKVLWKVLFNLQKYSPQSNNISFQIRNAIPNQPKKGQSLNKLIFNQEANIDIYYLIAYCFTKSYQYTQALQYLQQVQNIVKNVQIQISSYESSIYIKNLPFFTQLLSQTYALNGEYLKSIQVTQELDHIKYFEKKYKQKQDEINIEDYVKNEQQSQVQYKAILFGQYASNLLISGYYQKAQFYITLSCKLIDYLINLDVEEDQLKLKEIFIYYSLKLVEIVLSQGFIIDGGNELLEIIKDFNQLKKAQSEENLILEAHLQKVIGKHYTAIGDNKLALQHFEKSIQKYTDLYGQNDLNVLDLLVLLAECSLKFDKEKCLIYIEKINHFISFNQSIAINYHLAMAQKILAKYFLRNKQLELAEEYIQKSYKLFIYALGEDNQSYEIADCYLLMAQIAGQQGTRMVNKVYKLYSQALSCFSHSKMKHPNCAEILLNQAKFKISQIKCLDYFILLNQEDFQNLLTPQNKKMIKFRMLKDDIRIFKIFEEFISKKDINKFQNKIQFELEKDCQQNSVNDQQITSIQLIKEVKILIKRAYQICIKYFDKNHPILTEVEKIDRFVINSLS